MLGLHFEDCDAFGLQFSFDGCTLNHVSFYQTKLKKMVFRKGTLYGADFSGCDLGGAVFEGCDLKDAKFDNTSLEKADLRTAFNYSIDPTINRLNKARFALPAVIGLLDRFNILVE